MIIVRFGDAYDTAYVLPRQGEVDTWRAERLAIYARVGGLPGAFDYFGDGGYPASPVTFRKSFLVTGATYAAIETTLNAIRAATIDRNTESKLWLLKRDTSYMGGQIWTRAKCIGYKSEAQAGFAYSTRVEVEFYAREGIDFLF